MSWSLARWNWQVSLVPYKAMMSSLSLLFTSSSRTCRQHKSMLFLLYTDKYCFFIHYLKTKACYLKITRICERFIITELLPCLWTQYTREECILNISYSNKVVFHHCYYSRKLCDYCTYDTEMFTDLVKLLWGWGTSSPSLRWCNSFTASAKRCSSVNIFTCTEEHESMTYNQTDSYITSSTHNFN